MSKAKVNQEVCIGCGTCEALCPNVFKLKDGKAQVVAEECGDCNCQEVVESCPVGAITIEK